MSPARLYAGLIGAGLIATGLVGFLYASYSGGSGRLDETFGVLDVNAWHNLFHVLSGGVGLVAFALGERASRVYSLVGGAAYVIVALAGLALEMGELLLGLLPVNAVDTILHGALGAVGLAAWAAGPLRPRAGARA